MEDIILEDEPTYTIDLGPYLFLEPENPVLAVVAITYQQRDVTLAIEHREV